MKNYITKFNLPIILAITLFAQAPLQATADSASYSWWKIGTAVVATTATFIGGYLLWNWYSSRINNTAEAKSKKLETAALTNNINTLKDSFAGTECANSNLMIKANLPSSPFADPQDHAHIELPVLAFFLYHGNDEAVQFLLEQGANPNIALSREQEERFIKNTPFEKATTGVLQKMEEVESSSTPHKSIPFFSIVMRAGKPESNTNEHARCIRTLAEHKADYSCINQLRPGDFKRQLCGANLYDLINPRTT